MDPEPGETHIPGNGPEVETMEACLAACLQRNVHVVAVNFLQGRECTCSGGCPCFEPLGGDWLVALPANCQHQQPQLCKPEDGHLPSLASASSCMGFFDKDGNPLPVDTKMSTPAPTATTQTSFPTCSREAVLAAMRSERTSASSTDAAAQGTFSASEDTEGTATDEDLCSWKAAKFYWQYSQRHGCRYLPGPAYLCAKRPSSRSSAIS